MQQTHIFRTNFFIFTVQLLLYFSATTLFIALTEIYPAVANSNNDIVMENYLSLKELIEKDTEKNTKNVFDKDIDEVKKEMGIGFNFGNFLDWAFDNSKTRRYKIRISIGYDQTEYYYYESHVNMLGNLFTVQNRPDSLLPYAKLPLIPTAGIAINSSSPINQLWISVSNEYPEAAKYDLAVNVNYLNLIDNQGKYLLENAYSQEEIPVKISSSRTTVLVLPIETSVEDLNNANALIFADIQLKNYISDYRNQARKPTSFSGGMNCRYIFI